MLTKIILTGGGKFPFVDGVPQIYTPETFENCCCPAPCDCPCTTWPPESWPCGGLNETYTVDLFLRYTDYVSLTECSGDIEFISEYRIKNGPVTVTSGPLTPCLWQNDDAVVETRTKFQNDPFTAWAEIGSGVYVRLYEIELGCVWMVNASDAFFTFVKLTGKTPLFDYPGLFYPGYSPWASGVCYPAGGFFGVASIFEFSCEVTE